MATGTITTEERDYTYDTYFENGKLWHVWEVPVLNKAGQVVRYTTRRSAYAPEPGDYRALFAEEFERHAR